MNNNKIERFKTKKKLTVLIDGIHICNEMKGVGLYLNNVLKRVLINNHSLQIYLIVLDEPPSSILPKEESIIYLYTSWRNHLFHGFRTLPKLVQKYNPDVVLIPYETPIGFLRKQFLMVIHDIPQNIRRAQEYWQRRSAKEILRDKIYDFFLRRTLSKAEVVFSNSNYVASWLRGESLVDPGKIKLAPCAPGTDFQRLCTGINKKEVWEKLGTPHGYILVFFTGDLRENIHIVPAVYDKIVGQGLPHALVIAGVKENFKADTEALFAQFPWHDRIRLVPFLSVERVRELAEVYKGASVYLEPSLHEGFGMQVVEAMACGVPVICSDRGALPEVAGDAAIMVDPLDIDEISSAIIKVLTDSELEKELVNRGIERASLFSWETTAEVIYKEFYEVARKYNINN